MDIRVAIYAIKILEREINGSICIEFFSFAFFYYISMELIKIIHCFKCMQKISYILFLIYYLRSDIQTSKNESVKFENRILLAT